MAFFDTTWYLASGIAPVDQGSSNNASGATLTMVGASAPAGSCMIVVVHEATATTNGSLSDGVNTYAVVQAQTLGSGAGRLIVFRAFNVTQLVRATLTYTKAASGHVCSMSAFWTSGVLSVSDPVDSSTTATGSGTTAASPTLTSGTPATTGELMVCFFGMNSSAAVYTQSLGLTGTSNQVPTNVTAQVSAQIAGGWRVCSDTSTYTFAPTISGTVVGTAQIIIGLKPKTTIGYGNLAQWKPGNSYTAGTIVRQRTAPATQGNERAFICLVAGTSGVSGSEPAWTVTRGGKTTDNTVTWQECTGQAALNGDLTNTPNWTTVKNLAVTLGQIIQRNNGASYQICSTAGSAGNSAEPSFSNTAGTTTADNTITWTSLGAVGNYTAWGAPAPYLLTMASAGLTWGAAGNTFYCSARCHFECSNAASVQINPPGTFASPCLILSVDETASVPPNLTANLLAGATVVSSVSSLSGAIQLEPSNTGKLNYYYGMNFSVYANSSFCTLFLNSTACWTKYDSCKFTLASDFGGGATNITLGNSASGGGSLIEWLNTTVQADVGTAVFNIYSDFTWRETASALGNFLLTLGATASVSNTVIMEDLDLSLASFNFWINGALSTKALIKNCLLPSNYTFTASAGAAGPAGCIDVINSDSGATNYRAERHTIIGDQTTSTTVYRAGGFSIEGVSLGRKIVSGATNTSAAAFWPFPFTSQPIFVRNALVGANRTVTVYGLINAAAVPNNDQVWMDVEYMGSGASPLGSLASGTKATIYTTATAQTADSSTWDGGATARQNSHTYVVGDIIKVATNPGRLFFCTATTGNTSGSEPVGYASAVDGGAVTDGNATFRAGCRFSMAITLNAALVGLLTIYLRISRVSGGTIIFLDPLPVLS